MTRNASTGFNFFFRQNIFPGANGLTKAPLNYHITCLNFELSWIWGSLENLSESTSLMHKYIVISFIIEVLLPELNK